MERKIRIPPRGAGRGPEDKLTRAKSPVCPLPRSGFTRFFNLLPPRQARDSGYCPGVVDAVNRYRYQLDNCVRKGFLTRPVETGPPDTPSRAANVTRRNHGRPRAPSASVWDIRWYNGTRRCLFDFMPTFNIRVLRFASVEIRGLLFRLNDPVGQALSATISET